MYTNRFIRASVAIAVSLAFAAPVSCLAQTPTAGDSIHAAKTLFTWRDAALAGGFTGLTVAMFPIDKSLARRLQDSSTQANRVLGNLSRNIEYVADPGSIVIGVSMYAVGRVARWRELSDIGLHGTEAVAISGVLTGVIKVAAGRSRPYVSADSNPDDFALFRGRSNGAYKSFPSGHTTAAFAAASVVTSESQRWWPRGVWVVAPMMYGGATLVGLSRMYHNAHWASDVALGAAIGTFTGIKVVRYSHGHPNNPIDRFLLGLHPQATSDGQVGIAWSP